jgi:serine O-acetyltransferase
VEFRLPTDLEIDAWRALRDEAAALATGEPMLAAMLRATLVDQPTLEDALAHLVASKLASRDVSVASNAEVIAAKLREEPSLAPLIRLDLLAIVNRDPSADGLSTPFLYHKGFHALQVHRVAHRLWLQDRRGVARFLQARCNEVFAIDIHPAARIGAGIFIDHGTGVVIGETCVVGDNVSILQGVTLGGTGKVSGDRHPKVGSGVLIGAGAKILGNVQIGEGAKVGAGSVVLKDVPPHTTVVGVPAKIVGVPAVAQPALEMNQGLDGGEDG